MSTALSTSVPGGRLEFVRSNTRKEKPAEKKNQGQSELIDKEENQRPMKKPTLNISWSGGA
ncbi:hypothetical protein DVH24_000040 [Malus domestica]|uniref:Uncharacterized protein n=1 Tax=Malus domestica TaxID=3750 RepID=A0A498J4P3_MALDO|nr:hypothetical protein DVH24_000040 [Malus domestica]